MNTFISTSSIGNGKRLNDLARLLVFSLILYLSLPAISSAAAAKSRPKLPAGFVALSESNMTLADAKNFCQQHGGRLPRINNSDSWAGKGFPEGENPSIDGFGVEGARWPSGLPDGAFWSGTQLTSDPGFMWLINPGDGLVRADVFYDVDYRSLATGVVCVP